MVRRLLAAVLIASSPLALSACSTNAATGKSQFNSLSRSREIQMGEAAAPELTQSYGGAVNDRYLQDYVTRLGMTLVRYTEGDYASLPWEFTLLDSEVINAFALPGGKVFISRGLMREMTNEAQLAGVLGHEIGHVTAEHADQQISRQMLIAIGATAATVAAGQSDNEAVRYGTAALVSSAGVFNLKFGRDEELEADTLGIRYMTKAGYDPRGQLQVMEILRSASQGAPPEWLSTHPAPDTRIRRIERMIDGKYAYTQNNPKYVLNEARFQSEVLPRLRRLGAARSNDAGLTPPNALGRGCACCSGPHAIASAD